MKRNVFSLFEICKQKLRSLFFSWQCPFLKQRRGALGLGLLLVLSGCGGGGGVYYQPGIAINTINLQKVELSKAGMISYERQFFPVSYADSTFRDKFVEEGRKIFKNSKYSYFQEVKFCGSEYYVYESSGLFYGVDLIRKRDIKKVLFLPIPRYPRVFSSFPIAMRNSNFLVIYIEQQATSHSSTLFIINSNFKIVYKEHLLGAEEIGYTHSAQYGNCIILKSENLGLSNGVDKQQVSINGDWLYYIPDKMGKNISREKLK